MNNGTGEQINSFACSELSIVHFSHKTERSESALKKGARKCNMIIIVLVSQGQVIDMIDSAIPEQTVMPVYFTSNQYGTPILTPLTFSVQVPTSSEGISFFYLLSWWSPLIGRDSVDTNGCREGPVSIY